MSGRTKLPKKLNSLLLSEMEQAIREANLGEEDTTIARRCLISKWPHADIAAEVDCDRSTVSKRLKRIIRRVEAAAERIG